MGEQCFATARSSAPRMPAQRCPAGTLPPSPALRTTAELLGAMPPAQRAAAPNRTGLPDQLKAGIEGLSGMAMDDVRVHRNSSRPAQLNAHAYAQGTDIHLAPGQDHHLPHEAWHVVQQKQGRVQATMQLAAGTPVNDDVGLEHEADVMGARALQLQAMSVAPHGAPTQSSAASTGAIVQGHGLVIQCNRFKLLAALAAGSGIVGGGAYKYIKDQEDRIVADRKRWQSQNGGEGTQSYRLHHKDPLFHDMRDEIMVNHQTKPYVKDALHETQPIMSNVMHPTPSGSLAAFTSLFYPRTWFGTGLDATPGIDITNIDLLKNAEHHERAEAFRKKLVESGQDPNVTTLYSGHSQGGTNHIVENGHDPSYGLYHNPLLLPSKGHGALGRGTYLSDQVNKAVTYSSGGQMPGEERSFLQYDVTLGRTHETTNRGKFRHRHHNEMVKPPHGKTRAEGMGAPPEEVHDWESTHSILGKKTSTPGAGLLGTILHRNQFDSNEYLVRNPDQIETKARIFYKLAAEKQKSEASEKI